MSSDEWNSTRAKLFPESNATPQLLRKAAIDAKDYPAYPWSPRHADQLLRHVAMLLERCYATQQELADLETKAITYLLEDSIAEKNADVELRMSKLGLAPAHLDARAQDFATAAEALSQGTTPLERGMAAQSTGEANAAARAGALVREQEKLLDERFHNLKQHLENRRFRHTEDNSPFNFIQRHKRTSQILRQEFTEAYTKAIVAARGLQEVFGIPEKYAKPPEPNAKNLLTDMIVWARDAMQTFTFMLSKDLQVEAAFPIEKKTSATPLAQMSSIDFEVDLTDTIPQGYYPRIREIGFSVSETTQTDQPESHDNRIIRVTVGTNEGSFPIPCVAVQKGVVRPTYIGGPAVVNIAPKGVWRFDMSEGPSIDSSGVFPSSFWGRMWLHLNLTIRRW